MKLKFYQKNIALFYQILSLGIWVKVQSGESIKNILNRLPGIDLTYIENRIQTIFLNGHAVDNIDTAIISNNSTIALSAAMPGLVGATFRKSGVYKSLRSEISHQSPQKALSMAHPKKYRIKLKFFNFIAQEIGFKLLSDEIWIEGNVFQEFLNQNLKSIADGCSKLFINGKRQSFNQLLKIDFSKEKDIYLTVISGNEK